jgi:hypothetical protein
MRKVWFVTGASRGIGAQFALRSCKPVIDWLQPLAGRTPSQVFHKALFGSTRLAMRRAVKP